MSDQYDFIWSSNDKDGFTVQPQTKDTTSTSLVITGRGSPNWGRDLQQNLLKLLECFASDTPPANATTGQLWYDTTNKVLHIFDADAIDPWGGTAGGGVTNSNTAPANPKPGDLWYSELSGKLSMWNGTKWVQLYPQANDTMVKVAFVTEYNSMADKFNKIIGAPIVTTALTSAAGYGQTNTIPYESIFTLSNAKWIALLNRISNICAFLGVNASGLSAEGFMYESGNEIQYGIVTMLAKYQTSLDALNSIAAGTTSFKPSAGNLESVVPAGGQASRSTPWTNMVVHELYLDFANQAAMLAYFNSGGQIQMSSSLTGATTNRDFQWMAFLSTLGTVKFSATGTVDSAGHVNTKGIYDLTSSYQLIFSVANTANTQQVFTVNARLAADKTIYVQIQYIDPGTLYGGVGGTLLSSSALVRASQAVLASPIINYPTVTQSSLS